MERNDRRINFIVFLLLAFLLFGFNYVKAEWEMPSADPAAAIVPLPMFNSTSLNDSVYALIDRITTVTGNVDLLGNLSSGGSLQINGNMQSTGQITVVGDADFGNITASGDITANQVSASQICNNDQSVCRNLSDVWVDSAPFTETDPTVPAYLKDGITWNEVTNIPAGFADGLDNTAFSYSYYGINESTDNIKLGDSSFNVNNGNHNTSLGNNTLNNLSSGIGNTAVGYYSLYTNTSGSHNTGVGYDTLLLNDTGSFNTAVGSTALANNRADLNTAVGHRALQSNFSGTENTAIGYYAMNGSLNGSRNTAVGASALQQSFNGSNNVAIGFEACFNCTGDGNVAIGNQAGRNWTGNNRLFIANNSGTPLIGGDFAAKQVFVNGTLAHSSDIRLKENIYNLMDSYNKISQLRGVEFVWNETGKKDLGLIAQEVEKVFPELVRENDLGPTKYKSVNYSGLVAPLIEAAKEQQAKIESQQKIIEQLEQEISILENR